MASARKLQIEVDRTLKKIEEGLLGFDEMYEHVQAADGPAKQRLEGELKSEIKKLQKLRDQVKTWASGPDIKNKQPLVDARENIERRMEAFKLVEREMKTKAYSKEGLARTQAMSEEERKRMRAREWVQDAVSRLGDEIDEMEKEVETIAESGKGSKKERETEAHLEGVIKTHKLHQDKLEALTRLLDIGDVKTEDVDGIQEDVNYYISQARRPDDSSFEADFGIYDAFDLSEEGLEENGEEEEEGGGGGEGSATLKAAKTAAIAAAALASGTVTATTVSSGILSSSATTSGGVGVPSTAGVLPSQQGQGLNVKVTPLSALPTTATTTSGISSLATTPSSIAGSTLASAPVKASAKPPIAMSSITGQTSPLPPSSPSHSQSSNTSGSGQRGGGITVDPKAVTSSVGGLGGVASTSPVTSSNSGTRSGGSSFSGPSTSLPSSSSGSTSTSSNTLVPGKTAPIGVSLSQSTLPPTAGIGGGGGTVSSTTAVVPGSKSGISAINTSITSATSQPTLPSSARLQSSISTTTQVLGASSISSTAASNLGVGVQSIQGIQGQQSMTASNTSLQLRQPSIPSSNIPSNTGTVGISTSTRPTSSTSSSSSSSSSSTSSLAAASDTSTLATLLRTGSGGKETHSSNPPVSGSIGVGAGNQQMPASASNTTSSNSGGGVLVGGGSLGNATTQPISRINVNMGGNSSGQGGNMIGSGQVTPNASTVASPSNSSSTSSVAAASSRPSGRVGLTGTSSTSSSSSSSSSTSSQKQDSFIAALTRASRSASLTLPEPVLPNPWTSQTMAQLRFSASILSSSLQHLPEGVDERPKVHTVRQLNPTPHPSFPASPDYRLLDSPAAYERLSQDTLFFIFYHCQGGFQQYLAGRELKNRNTGWRFHKPHRTWFKTQTLTTEDPHDPPETGTNSTLYFDFDQEWAMINTTLVPPSNEFEHDE